MDRYLTTAAEGRTLAAGLPGLDAVLALDDDAFLGLATLASIDIDAAMAYQGQKFDITPGAQQREFPRIPYPENVGDWRSRMQFGFIGWTFSEDQIWDWDMATKTAIVPPEVKVACLYQMAWLLQPKFAARLEAIRSGLTDQKIGTASESMADAGSNGLGRRAHQIMAQYGRTTGKLL